MNAAVVVDSMTFRAEASERRLKKWGWCPQQQAHFLIDRITPDVLVSIMAMQTIELPDHIADHLVKAAASSGRPLDEYVQSLLANHDPFAGLTGHTPLAHPSSERLTYRWEDHDVIREAMSVEPVDINATRQALAGIPGSLADDIRRLRDERF